MRTRELVAVVFRDLKLLCAAFVIPLIAAGALYVLAPRRFDASAKILVNVKGAQSLLVSDSGGPQTTAVEVINSEVEVLTSRDLADRTAKALAGGAPIAPLTETQFKAFQKALTVKAVAASQVIDVTFEAPSAALAARTLNAYLEIYRKMRDPQGPGSVTDLIREQLRLFEDDLDRADNEISRIRGEAGLFDPDLERKNLLDSRNLLAASAMQLRAHAAEMRAKVSSVDAQKRTTPATIAQFPTGDESDGMIKTRAQLLDLRAQQVKLAPNYQPDSRVMRDLQAQIEITQAALAAETQKFAGRTKLARNPLYDALTAEATQDAAQVAPDERHAATLEAQTAQIDHRLIEISKIQTRLQPLVRRRTDDAASIEALRQRQAAAAVGAGGNRALQDVSLIEAPAAPSDARPAKPKRLPYLLGGVVGGAALAGGVLAAAFVRKNTFLVPEAVEGATGIPVLVSLPALKG